MSQLSSTAIGRIAEITSTVMLATDLSLLPIKTKTQPPATAPAVPTTYLASEMLPASPIAVSDLSIVKKTPSDITSARAIAETLTGFAPDVPELLAVVSLSDTVSGSAVNSVGACFDLRAQTDALLIEQMTSIVSASADQPSIKSLARSDPRQSDAVKGSLATLSEISAACERFRDALEPRSLSDRLTPAYIASSELQARVALLYGKCPAATLSTFGYVSERVYRLHCTASKAFLLLCQAAKLSVAVTGCSRRELATKDEAATSLSIANSTRRESWPSSNTSLRDLINCEPARVNQVISLLETALKNFIPSEERTAAQSAMLLMLAREYRLSAGAVLNNLQSVFTLNSLQQPSEAFSSVVDIVYGSAAPNVLAQQQKNDCMGLSVTDRILTFEDDYIDDRAPGQQFYIDAALGGAGEFDVTRLQSLSQSIRQRTKALAAFLLVALEPEYVPRADTTVRMRRANEFGGMLADALSSSASQSDPYVILLAASVRDRALAASLVMYAASRLTQYFNEGAQFLTTRDTSQITPLSDAAKRAIFLRIQPQYITSDIDFDYALAQQSVISALESKSGAFNAVIKLMSEVMSNFRAVSAQEKTLFSGVRDGDVLLCLHDVIAMTAARYADRLVTVTHDGRMLIKRQAPDQLNFTSQQIADVETAAIAVNVALHSFLTYAADAAESLTATLVRADVRDRVASLASAAGESVKLLMTREQLALAQIAGSEFFSSSGLVISPSALSSDMMRCVASVCSGAPPTLVIVGLPYGFMRTVTKRVSPDQSLTGQTTNDVIRVSVHARNILDPAAVFAPQTYLFDVRRFVDRSSTSRPFAGTAIETLRTMRVDGQPQTVDEAIGDDAYAGLSDSEAEDIVRNHVISFCCEALLRTAFDADFDELKWFIDGEPEFDSQLARALFDAAVTPVAQTTRSDVVRTTARQILSPRQVLTQKQAVAAHTAARIVSAVCASLTALSSERAALISLFRARKFERVFVIPVDVAEMTKLTGDTLTALSVSVEGIE